MVLSSRRIFQTKDDRNVDTVPPDQNAPRDVLELGLNMIWKLPIVVVLELEYSQSIEVDQAYDDGLRHSEVLDLNGDLIEPSLEPNDDHHRKTASPNHSERNSGSGEL